MQSLGFNDPPPPRNSSAIVWNILTALVLLTTVCLIGVFALLFINPNTPLNPFPPPTLPVALSFPTETPTPRVLLPPTWTPSPTLEPTATNTPHPTATLPPTETPFSLVTATSGAEATTEEAKMPFVIQSGHPVAIANIAHPEKGCDWMGVAGQVFDIKNSPIRGQQVILGGFLSGSTLPNDNNITLTGLAPQYGAGYFEFEIADHPIASKGALWLQLVDQQGLPMSEKTSFDTFSDCDKNLIIVNFKQVR